MVAKRANIPNLIGHSIDNGRLKIVSIVGAGSNGIVFLAHDTTSSPECPMRYALKCIPKAFNSTGRQSLQQRQEIANHMRASMHPNVLTLYRVVEDGPYLFLVMDYCSGGDLFQYLFDRRMARGNDVLVKKLFLQIIDAVDACHNLGIYHRDLKPENIMCSADNTQLYLCDFGLSTRDAYSTVTGVGSSFYMSPECIGQDELYSEYPTRANDIWALGVILTAMISGHNPWRRAVAGDACYRAYLRDPNFLMKTLPISASANILLQRIFTPEPSSRITLPFLRLRILQIDTFFSPKIKMPKFIRNVPQDAISQISTGRRRSRRFVFGRRARESDEDSGSDSRNIEKRSSRCTPNSFGSRSQRADEDWSATFSTGESSGPRTPEPPYRDQLSDITVCLDSGGRPNMFVSTPEVVNGVAKAKPSRSILRRVANRLSFC